MTKPVPPPRRLPSMLSVVALSLGLVACQQTAPEPQQPTSPTLTAQALSNSRLAGIKSFATYYNLPDLPTLDRLSKLELAIVQPNITDDQRRAIQTLGNAVVYLAIGEIGPGNNYYVGGQTLTGQQIINQHGADNWFVGVNKSYNAPLLNLTNPAVRNFVLEQADALSDRGFDGLFLDTADDAELFTTGNPVLRFENSFVVLNANRPDYATMKRAYIDTIKALRSTLGTPILIQNGGFDLLLDRENNNDGSERVVDAVMHEVATTLYRPVGGSTDTLAAANYSSWRDYYRDTSLPQAQRDADKSFRDNRDAHAREYRGRGGVVLAQDFAVPARQDLICWAYSRAKSERWVPSYADAFFAQLFDFPETTAAIKANEGCGGYNFTISPDYSLTATPRVAYSAQGRSSALSLKLGSIKGYNANVTFSLGTLPAGITANLTPGVVAAGSSAPVTLNLSVTSSRAPGELIVPVRATSQGYTTVYDFRLVVVAPNERLLVTNAGNSTLLAFDNIATLTSASSAQVGASGIRQGWSVIADANGYSYVAERVSDPSTPARILKYAPYNLSMPVQEITQGLNLPTGLAVDASGSLFVANFGGTAQGNNPCTDGEVIRFAPGSSLKSGGFTITTNPNLVYGCPKQLAFGADGRLWVTTSFGLLLSYSHTGTTAQLETVTQFSGSISEINSLTFDAAGNLWISGKLGTAGTVLKLPATKLPAAVANPYTVNIPSSDVTVYHNGLYEPFGLSFDAAGNLWVVNQTDASGTGPGGLLEFTAASLGASTATPALTLPLPSRFTLAVAVQR